jgi:hypothetical protein
MQKDVNTVDECNQVLLFLNGFIVIYIYIYIKWFYYHPKRYIINILFIIYIII